MLLVTFSGENSVADEAAHINSRAFFSANPVFRREEYARALDKASGDRSVTSLLNFHTKSGNLKRLARGVYASVPAHIAPGAWIVDRYLGASKLRSDAVLAYHSALELHGAAYTDTPEVQIVSGGDPTLFETPDFSCRALKYPAGFDAARDVTHIDRSGLKVAVTTLERTIVDAFDRFSLVGGAEELWDSLALVVRVKAAVFLDQARELESAAAAAALGWWLETEQQRLGVPNQVIEGLRELSPKHPQYVLGSEAGEAKSIAEWNILVPKALANPSFEGG